MTEHAIAKLEPVAAPAIVAPSETSAIISIIERAITDPSIDVGKLERLLDMQERVMNRQAKEAFAVAFSDMQPELPIITERGTIDVPAKDGKKGHSTPFARFEDIQEAVRPILYRFGFGISFKTTANADGRPVITTILTHKMGHSEQTEFVLPLDTTGSKNNVQAVGSSTSYGKRYGMVAILNIISRAPMEKDDDGLAADAPELVSTDQVAQLRKALEDNGGDIVKFCAYIKVGALADIRADKFAEAMKIITTKGRGNANSGR